MNVKQFLNSKVIGGLAFAIVVYVLYRNGSRWWQQLSRRDQGNYQGQESATSNPARQAELETMAHDTYTALHSVLMLGGVTATGREYQMEKLMVLNDTELRYVAKYYESAANPEGQSLRKDLEDEWMPFTDVDERLIGRLSKMAL